jgi:hypothetical protein
MEKNIHLTDRCELRIRDIGRDRPRLVFEVRQRVASGHRVTTLLLDERGAGELAEALRRLSGGGTGDGD